MRIELLGTEIEKALNIKITSKGLRPARLFHSALLRSLGPKRSKHLEINGIFQLFQRVF
jgi:hypothetical protein